MFRGKESSNRIKNILISSRLNELWCFGLPAALGEGAGGWGCLEVNDKSTTPVKEKKKKTSLDEPDKLLRSISFHRHGNNIKY